MIIEMRSAAIPIWMDWASVTTRWAFLVGLALASAFGVQFTQPLAVLLIIAALYNIGVTLLLILDKSDVYLRLASVLVDLIIAHLIFWFTGTVNGSLIWLGVLPLLTAALHFSWIGAIVMILVNVAVQLGLAQLDVPIQQALLPVALILFVYLLVGLPTAHLSQTLKLRARGGKSRSNARSPRDTAETERRRTIYEMISALSESLNYQRVLETALELSVQTLTELDAPADRMISAVLLFGESSSDGTPPALQIAAFRRLLPVDQRITLPGTQGVIGRAIDEGMSSLTRIANKDPELSKMVSLTDCRSAYCIPLRTGLDAYGILLFAHPDVDFFTPNRREVLDIVGHQAVIAIQNARLYRDLEQEKNRMMEIQEEARKKMARDLHDGPTQSVSAIAMRVNFARRLMEKDPKSAAEELYKIEELARRTTKEIRHMLFTLRPLVLESQGLIAALQSMAEKMRETYNQNVIIQADPGVVDALELGKQAVVFYIAEEAINNARKHATAEHIWVRLKLLRDGLSLLEIEDDGKGFNVTSIDAAYDNRGSLGMVNMRERSDLLNGVLRIDSAEGRGTRIQVVIPLTEEAADRLRHSVS